MINSVIKLEINLKNVAIVSLFSLFILNGDVTFFIYFNIRAKKKQTRILQLADPCSFQVSHPPQLYYVFHLIATVSNGFSNETKKTKELCTSGNYFKNSVYPRLKDMLPVSLVFIISPHVKSLFGTVNWLYFAFTSIF